MRTYTVDALGGYLRNPLRYRQMLVQSAADPRVSRSQLPNKATADPLKRPTTSRHFFSSRPFMQQYTRPPVTVMSGRNAPRSRTGKHVDPNRVYRVPDAKRLQNRVRHVSDSKD